jgi:hypothetical protein
MRLKMKQGSQFWSAIDTDLVLRAARDHPGLNHRISLGYDEEEMLLTTSISSNLQLVYYLLYQQNSALEHFQTIGELDPEVVERIQEQIDELEALIEEHQ